MKRVNFKSIKIAGAFLLATSFAMGQGAADKRVQAGLTGNFGLNMVNMATSKMDKNGVGTNLSIGVAVHTTFKNSKNLGLSTGLEFDFGSLKFKPAQPTYYGYNDTDVMDKQTANDAVATFQLTERTQKPLYATIPLMFLFKTDFIGDFRYYGKFGVRNSFLISQKINDEGTEFTNALLINGTPKSNENMKAPGEMFFYNGSIGLAAGAEWNFVGSTCLTAEVGYYYGITPLYLDRNDNKKTLYTMDALYNRTYFSNKANMNQLMLKIAILF